MNEIEKAIRILKEYIENCTSGEEEQDKRAFYLAISALEAQQADMWIPILKKMPNNYSEVYVTTQSRKTYHVFYSNNQFRFGNYSSDLICRSAIAWMPFYIPKPWEEKQSC